MKDGWMWFDDDKKRTTEEKVALAIVAYRNKHGYKPNACYLHVSHPCLERVGPVNITHVPHILPNHFWLGIEEKEKERDATP